jgi:A/G-specific adenine glycosylase
MNRPPDHGPDLDPAWLLRIRDKLRDWYDQGHRALPWRETRDPYRILVSEMMLVQTTVAATIPYFHRFLARFPSVQSLADAPDTAVLKAWEGLGYYRRARQLQAAARTIVAEHGGTVPQSLDALRSLPGVGRYVAGAIRSFAFDLPAPIVEANTQRVLARLLAWEGDLASPKTIARLWRAAERLVPEQGAGAFNQAIMELGATVCAPKSPSCLLCPVAAECEARKLGIQDRLPVKSPRPAPLPGSEACAMIRRPDDGRVLIVQRGPGRLWADFWEFPTVHLSGADPAGRAFAPPLDLAGGFERLTGVRVSLLAPLPSITYGVTKHRITLTPYRALPSSSEPPIPGPGLLQAIWEAPESLSRHSFSAAGRKLIPRACEPFENH